METFTRNWWLFIVRGVLALLWAAFAIAQPAAAIAALVIIFGVYALADGLVALYFTFKRDNAYRGWSLFEGIVGVAAGILTFMRPGLTALALYSFIAAWAFLTGIAEVAIAVSLRKAIRGEGWLIAQGVISVAFGVLMVALPRAGVIALIGLVAGFAAVSGVMWIALGIELSQLHRNVQVRDFGGTPVMP
jgi:uncharacterized membrane protein HdeD (DUF308 family)